MSYNEEKDYYKILEVAEDASTEEINKKYRQQARAHHPDRGGSEEQMKEINEAYTVLNNSETRRQYNDSRGIVNSQASARQTRTRVRRERDENLDIKVAGDLFGLVTGALFCLIIGVPLLLLIETQWVFFLWPLRILAVGINCIGLMLAHAAYRYQRKEIFKFIKNQRVMIIISELIFWSAIVLIALLFVFFFAEVSLPIRVDPDE